MESNLRKRLVSLLKELEEQTQRLYANGYFTASDREEMYKYIELLKEKTKEIRKINVVD